MAKTAVAKTFFMAGGSRQNGKGAESYPHELVVGAEDVRATDEWISVDHPEPAKLAEDVPASENRR